MVVYFILLLVPILITLLMKNKKNRAILYGFFTTIVFLLALRKSTIGRDTQTYIDNFYRISKLPWNKILVGETAEFGFTILNKLISVISVESWFYLFIVSIISVIPLCIVYAEESENTLLTVAIYVILPNYILLYSGIRQSIALGIGSLSYLCVKRKKPILFIIIILIAAQFHSSAIILFSLYPIYYAKITRRWLIIIMPLIVLVFIFKNEVFNFLMRFLEDRYQDRYGYTQENGAYSSLVLFLMFTLYTYLLPTEKVINQNFIGLRNFLLVSVILQIFASINMVAMRINYYFIMFMPITLTKVENCTDKEEKKLVALSELVMIVVFIIYVIATIVMDKDPLDIYPYQFFWV